ncbi:MAG: hypothetical protein ACR2GQ_02330 [Gemmatimonadota bacterium]
MRIAIDYDGTWDRDPEAFLAVALAFRDAGHEVVMVTVRSERRPGSRLPSVPPWITVYATGLAPPHTRSHGRRLSPNEQSTEKLVGVTIVGVRTRLASKTAR